MDMLHVSLISKCKQSIVSMCCPRPQNTAFTAVFTTSCIWFGKTLMVTYVWTPLVCFVDTSNPSD